MIADWSRLLRLALVLSIGLLAVARPLHGTMSVAWADDDDDDDGGDDDDDDDGGGDDDDDEEEDEDQPPVTAGGLYSKESYPQAELQRPLTMTKGMNEIRFGIDIDVSAANAFENWGIGFDYRRGIEDNVELQLDFRSALNNFSAANEGVTSDLDFKAAIEAGIVYDLVDFRLALDVPFTKGGHVAGMPTDDSETLVNFEMGFPFRYAVKDKGGIVALDTFMTFNTNGKPDLTPSVGIIVQPVPMLAAKVQAKLVIIDFNTDAGNFQIPVSINIQFSPKNLIDIGGEFTFPNLKPAEDPVTMETPKFYDSRFLLLYGQLRL